MFKTMKSVPSELALLFENAMKEEDPVKAMNSLDLDAYTTKQGRKKKEHTTSKKIIIIIDFNFPTVEGDDIVSMLKEEITFAFYFKKYDVVPDIQANFVNFEYTPEAPSVDTLFASVVEPGKLSI